MDKYEFNIKVEQMRKMVNRGDYETAMKIADTIDWKKVRNANLLSMVATIYEKNHEYQDAKDILLLAFERAPIGKRLLYKLTDLALKEGNVEEAEAYYREFCDLAGDDPRQHLLRYMILRTMDAPLAQQIHSLEGYTSEELDEKWLYELAELYHEAGDEQRCVSTCDKIMLMFGLGKYVDKAMELKLQYAPLTKYQMDLVENRDKYEEKLRAVEQQSYGDYADDGEETEPAAAPVRRPAAVQEEPEPVVTVEEPDVPAEPVHVQAAEAAPESSVPVVPVVPAEPEAVVAQVRQAETEEVLAREMSRLSQTADAEEPDELGKTRVLGTIRRRAAEAGTEPAVQPAAQPTAQPAAVPSGEPALKPAAEMAPVKAEGPAPVRPEVDVWEAEDEPELPKMTNHLMIEARTPEKGLEIAVAALRQIQKETGIKNPVAKITGSKLNKRGILASREKLAGKDLMIEEAGDLSPEMLKELEKLMSQDTTGMRIVLIDNPKQMEMLHAENPILADKFECIGSDYPLAGSDEKKHFAAEVREESRPEPSVTLVQAEAPVREAAEAVMEPEVDDRPVRRIVPVRDEAMRAPEPEDYYEEPEQEPYTDDETEMDIDEFAQYACKYASEIDCSITGKSMLALYERIEIMEEDGIPLTRATAEDLIEEAADKAEKPSVGKRIKGLFSSKYDKDGLLILKEEHFI